MRPKMTTTKCEVLEIRGFSFTAARPLKIHINPPFLKGGRRDYDYLLDNPPKSPFRKGGL
jgi:hypothetical protein